MLALICVKISPVILGCQYKIKDFALFLKDLEFICDKKLSQANVSIMNAVIDCRGAMARNANLALVMENFIIAVKK